MRPKKMSHLYSGLVGKPETDGTMVCCGTCLIEVFTKSSGSADVYRNQFHVIEDEVSAFTA